MLFRRRKGFRSLAHIRRARKVLAQGTTRNDDSEDTAADFTGADLSNAKVEGNFSANAGDTNLSGADLRGAYVASAYFPRADFTGADLAGTGIFGAWLKGAKFRGADFTGARISTQTSAKLKVVGGLQPSATSPEIEGAHQRNQHQHGKNRPHNKGSH